MKKTTVLGVLAAVSLGGVGCAVEGDEQAAEQTADATAATWPARMPEDRGCVAGTAIPSGPFAGKHLRLRFPFPGAVWFQFYDPATGLLIDEPRGWSLRAAGRDGSTLELVTSGTSSSSVDGKLTRKKLGNGSVVIEVEATASELREMIGGASLRVGCDVDPGARALKNPKMPTLATTKPVPANASYPFPIPASKTCMASAQLPGGDHAGDLLRLRFEKMPDNKLFVSAEVYSRETGYVIDTTGWYARKLASGGYELGTTSTSTSWRPAGRLVPMEVDGKRVLVLEPQGDDVVVGRVPLSCDFLP